jgi:hypothetical protein
VNKFKNKWIILFKKQNPGEIILQFNIYVKWFLNQWIKIISINKMIHSNKIQYLNWMIIWLLKNEHKLKVNSSFKKQLKMEKDFHNF